MFKRNPLINPNAMSISIIDSGATPTAHLTSEMLLQGRNLILNIRQVLILYLMN